MGASFDGSQTVLFTCTGNAARSVMGAALLRAATPLVNVDSAGTHSIPGLPMSVRTRGALDAVGVSDPDHLSTQLDDAIGAQATLIVVFEPMHITWIRKHLPQVADRAGSLPRLARDLSGGSLDSLERRIGDLGLETVDFEPWEEIVDPAGGELGDFVAAAEQIAELVDELVPKLGDVR